MSNSTISDQSLVDKSMRSVFVGNIPYEATEEYLKDIFSDVGPVLSFKFVFDHETGKSKGFGFCEYNDQETALSAMRNLNGYEIDGRTGQNTENPYGEVVQANKAPEAIIKAVASLLPEQMFELMKQMKLCVQNNPNEARQILLQNPQLAYTFLQAQLMMRIADPLTAINMLHKANPIPGVLVPPEKAPVLSAPPPRIEEPCVSTCPLPPIAVNPLAPITNPFANQDVDLRTMERQIDPRIARMDQGLRGPSPQTTVPPPPVTAPNVPAVADPRTTSNFTLPETFGTDPRAERFPRDPRDPRDPRVPVDLIMAVKPNAAPTPTIAPPPVPVGTTAATGTSISSSSARLMAGMSPAGNILSGATDQEKAALIMQVLQLSDEQIAMFPPEQRQSILVLKEQIVKSMQR